jgi:hypothetical protein
VFYVIVGDTSEERVTDGDEDTVDGFYPRALAGFILVMTEEGDMIYLGDSVSKHLGIPQVHTAPCSWQRLGHGFDSHWGDPYENECTHCSESLLNKKHLSNCI